MTNTISAFNELSFHRPAVDAIDTDIAKWYADKALLHEFLAMSATGPERDAEKCYASEARAHADRLYVLAKPN